MATVVQTLLCSGFDSVVGARMEPAITGAVETTGGASNFFVKFCESQSAVADALSIDASLSASYMATASMTAKMEFMQSLTLTDRNVAVIVRSRHELGTSTITSPTLAPGINVPATAEAASSFCRKYGDSYIDSVSLGAEYFAVYVFRTQTRDEQKSLSTSFAAKFSGASVKVEGSTQVKLTHFLQSSGMNSELSEKVIGFKNPTTPAPDKIAEFAREFLTLTPDAPSIIQHSMRPYESVGGLREGLAQLSAARTYFMGTDRKEGALASRRRLMGVRNQINWLNGIYECYQYEGDPGLATFAADVEADIDRLDAQIVRWKANPIALFEPPALLSLAKGDPVLAFNEPAAYEFGGSGGGPIDFGPVSKALKSRRRLSAIRLRGETERVNRIELEYKEDGSTYEVTFGGMGGSPKSRIEIEEHDFPREFIWVSNKVVEFLAILLTTNPKKGEYAGSSTKAQSSWIVPEGHRVIGIGGRAGEYVDRIQIIYVALQPARFVKRQ